MKLVVALMIAGTMVIAGMIGLAPEMFATIASNRWLQILIGAVLTVTFIVAMNIDFDWIGKIIRKLKILRYSTKELRSLAKEVFDLLDKVKALEKTGGSKERILIYFGSFIAGMGIMLRNIGVEFYFQDEINEMIGKALEEVNSFAGWFWRTVMQFRIPYVDWTPFDVFLSFALGGPMNVISDIIIGTVIMEVVAPVIDNVVTGAIIRLLSS